MVGDIFLNFTKDKTLTVNLKDGDEEKEIEIDNGRTGLQLRLTKEQTRRLRSALDKA